MESDALYFWVVRFCACACVCACVRARACSGRGELRFSSGLLSTFSFRYIALVLWRCWLGGRKGIRPVKTERLGAGVAICLERGADLHMAQLMPLPLTVSCSNKILIGFTFLVPAHPGSPGKRAVKRVCVYYHCYELSHSSITWLQQIKSN